MMSDSPHELSTRCCITGGGPAGMMLGYLLARAGVDVIVLEKWPDFFRDFRGDTIHPSTLEVLRALDLLDGFLALDPDKAETLGGVIGGQHVTIADFTHLPVYSRFIALIPQWDFLDFLAREARRYPGFHPRMKAEATGLAEENGRIAGVKATSRDGLLTICAELVVGADGRHSTMRAQAGLVVKNIGAPMDVLWFRLSRNEKDATQPFGTFDHGRILVLIARGDYWQCGFVIPKDGFELVRAFHSDIATLAPAVADRVHKIENFDSVKLLSVAVDRLVRWQRDGLLCIGDAAHAMSPIGGVGINLAIQDAVAAANILIPAFRRGRPNVDDLKAVQRRREYPTRATQALQVFLQNRVIKNVLGRDERARLPLLVRLVRELPQLSRIPACIIGLGFRREQPNEIPARLDTGPGE